MSGLFDNSTIAVFGATGAVGSAVVEHCLDAGATVFASGHRADAVDRLAERFPTAYSSVVDATDTAAVQSHLDEAIEITGRLDGVINTIGGRPHLLGYPEPVASMSVEQFLLPLQRILGSQYVTSSEAALRMSERGGGSIVTLSATLSSMTAAHMANLSATCAAIEGMTRALAGEFGPAGIRVNCVRASAMPETRTIQETGAAQMTLGSAIEPPMPPLGRPITVDDTAATAVFLLSDRSPATTGQTLTVCGGQFV